MQRINITATANSQQIVDGVLEDKIISADGNFYADPSVVKTALLKKTEHTYQCPYKGLCYYYDLIDETGSVITTDFTWVYETPSPGWEIIAGKFGFYPYSTENYQLETIETDASAA